MSEEFGGKDMETVRLFDAYGALLTERQRKIAELYYNYDLSLGEIAEENGVSRQSVSDCLGKVDRRLKEYEKKLGFVRAAKKVSAWAERLKAERPELTKRAEELTEILERRDG